MGTDPNRDTRFREVYDATFDDVRRFCLRRLPVADVNDAVAEVYLVAWRRVDRLPRGDETLPWLYGVARNVVRHAERSNRRRLRLATKATREPTATVAGPETYVVRRSEDEALIAGIGRLSLSDQEVVRLRAWENLTAPAIALVVGCSVSAAEKRLARALQRLEKTLTTRNSQTDLRATIPGEGGA